MIVPNKAVPYEASLLSKLPILLQIISKEQIPVIDLYHRVQSEFENVSQFLLTLDTLFVLGKIDFIDGELKYVD